MHTELSPALRDDPEAQAAARRIQACVHCGFCTATCPSYQVLGNELDSPRGRIYLIKQVLEGAPATRDTQQHLDRCLTCRACETTCPSGVQYGALLDTGRALVDAAVPRPWRERWLRAALGAGLTSRAFAPALRPRDGVAARARRARASASSASALSARPASQCFHSLQGRPCARPSPMPCPPMSKA